jgi:D-aspartate ligase
MPSPGALLVGGAHVSIGVARGLGRQGIPVWLLANHPLPTYSRYVKRSFDWPGADHPDGLASIIDVIIRHGLQGWVLFPTGDQDLRLIAQNHALLSSYVHVAAPDWKTAQWLYDKRLTYQRAADLRMDFPLSYKPRDLDDLRELDCRFPVVLKPAFRHPAFAQAKAWRADDRDTLVALYQKANALIGDAVIVQEWVPGNGTAQFSFTALCERGKPLATLTARRTRQHPIDFGRSSTFVETIENPRVEELGRSFLASLDYTGVAEVEFKYDARDDRYKLLDVNGRFWTWCGLGPLAGVDFAALAWRQALGEKIEPVRARPGVAWVHMSRDIVAAFQEVSAGSLRVRDYLKSFRKPLCFANFALDDPQPALAELPAAAINRVTTWLGARSRPAPATRQRLAK